MSYNLIALVACLALLKHDRWGWALLVAILFTLTQLMMSLPQ